VTPTYKALVAALEALLGGTASDLASGSVGGPAAAPVQQQGVLLDWEEIMGDGTTAGTAYARLAHVRPNNARGTATVHWPLPEAAWIDSTTLALVRGARRSPYLPLATSIGAHGKASKRDGRTYRHRQTYGQADIWTYTCSLARTHALCCDAV
jgi:hypothetical protein